MDAHASEYRAAVAGMADTYGRNCPHAVGDSIWVRQPGTVNTPIRAVVIGHLEDGRLHVSVHHIGGGREHLFVALEDVLDF